MSDDDWPPRSIAPRPDAARFRSRLAGLDRDLGGPDGPTGDQFLPDAAAPLVTIPGRRPLLDLFPVFFPSEAEAVQPAAVPAPAAPSPAMPLTYEPFFGLKENPFAPTADPRFLYRSMAFDKAAQDLLGAIGRRDRLVVLTGTEGLGKTTLCRAIVEPLDRRTLTSLVTEPTFSIEALLRTLLVDFGVVSREHLAKGQLRYASYQELADVVRDFLASLVRLQANALVIIDDAHRLSIETLTQLRPLIEPEPFLQFVLVGEPELHETLERPELRPLLQCVGLQTTLGRLARDEIAGYVLRRLTAAGNPHIELDDAALWQIERLSRGVPGVVNMVCDRAFAEGQRSSISVIDQPLIDAAGEALGLAPPQPPASRFLRGALVALALALLVLAGAAAAAFVFRAEIAAIVSQWHATRLPPAPSPR